MSPLSEIKKAMEAGPVAWRYRKRGTNYWRMCSAPLHDEYGEYEVEPLYSIDIAALLQHIEALEAEIRMLKSDPNLPRWRLVPVEPTPEMLLAAVAVVRNIEADLYTAEIQQIYRAMLAASPAYLSPALRAFMDRAAIDSARSET